jgi:hypothetical protein
MGHRAYAAAPAAPVALGVYTPRRPQASPLFRLVQDQLHRLQTVYDERFAREDGPWRPVVDEVTDKFLACGILEHGFARVRCDACAHEYLLAFSCKAHWSGHWSGPFGACSGPRSARHLGATTRGGADRATRNAGRPAHDHPGTARGRLAGASRAPRAACRASPYFHNPD